MAKQNSRGFTLIELVVILGITTLLTAVLITYSRTGEKQIRLFRDQASAVNAILRAKSLAIQTQLNNPPTGGKICGYGVHFEETRYIIFRDLVTGMNCAISDQIYSGPDEIFETKELAEGNYFKDLVLSDILFIPPDPRTVLNPPTLEAKLTLGAREENLSVEILVNNFGQVSTP